MLYVQLKERLTVRPGAKLCVGDVAEVLGDQAKQAKHVPLPLSLAEGVWRIPATMMIEALLTVDKEISVLGADEIFIHATREKQNASHPIRAAIAFVILFFGSALAIAWFHADVGMEEAQKSFLTLWTGRGDFHPLLTKIPYAVGVALGVGGYYSLLTLRKTVSPLDIKLGEYRSKAEKTAGKMP